MILLYFVTIILSVVFSIGFVLLVLMQFIAVFTTDAPFVPVPNETENYIVKTLDLKPDDVLYDLGCGDGKVLLKVVQAYPFIKAVGVEIAFFPFLLAKFKTRNYPNVIIKRENIFKTNISEATHIFLYLYPKVIDELIKNIRQQCHSGVKIVSCDFSIQGETPTKIVDINNNSIRGKKLFVYTV